MDIPPKTEDATQEAYMNDFTSWLVDTTKNSSSTQKITDDCKNLFSSIINPCRELMATNAKNGRSKAVIYMYWIKAKHEGASIHDLLFPEDNLKDQMDKLELPPVIDQIRNHLSPIEVEHRLYNIRKNEYYEIRNYTGSHVDLSELLSAEGGDEQLNFADIEPGYCVGVITADWSHLME